MPAGARLEPAPRPPGRRVALSFYDRDARAVARDLLGLLVCRRLSGGGYLAGRIVEVEAYVGEGDPACHAAAGLTPRTRILYGPPGRAYVYFTYGMHHCLNVVTGPGRFPAAVLIRALHPEAGLAVMARRREGRRFMELTSWPARLCRAFDVDLRLNGAPLRGPDLSIRTDGAVLGRIASGPRVGIRVGTDHPWRYWVEGDPFVSSGRPGAPPPRRRTAGRGPAARPTALQRGRRS